MPCYHPIHGWRVKTGRLPNGKWPITFNPKSAYLDMPVVVPCGRCIGCRLDRSRQWAIRCVHELQYSGKSCFCTLTYDNDHLPLTDDGLPTLRKEDMTKFLKRLRKAIYPVKIRYIQCGEYGEKLQRPHHHIIIYGYDFPDKEFLFQHRGNNLYVSDMLSKLWPYGIVSIGAVSFESCAYVARYVLKKMTGAESESWYAGRLPEYITMSRRPGIGFRWYAEHKDYTYDHDWVLTRLGIKCKPPRYYDKLYDIDDPDKFHLVKLRRLRKAADHEEEDYRRLSVKERCKKLQSKSLVRCYEQE